MPTALIITTAGTNCDLELAQAFEMAGAETRSLHVNELLTQPGHIDDFDLIGLPGGFSYGDAVAAGRIKAQLMRGTLYTAFVRAIERGVPMIAPCNGFQVLAQMGLLPGPGPGEPWPQTAPTPTVALGQNESARFIDEWCAVEVPAHTRCIWTQDLRADAGASVLPVAHGEGRFIVSDARQIAALDGAGQIAVCYASGNNPNGSMRDIAGICDTSGLVFGLMPHPERYTRWTHHPQWTRLSASEKEGEPLGLRMFRNAVAHAEVAVSS